MSVKNAQDAFNKLFDDAKKKFENKFTAGLSRGKQGFFLTSITFGGQNTVESCIKGINDALDDFDTKQVGPSKPWRRLNKKKVWAKLIKDVLADVKSTKNFGDAIQGIQEYSVLRNWKQQRAPRGYFFDAGKSIRNIGGVNAITLLTFQKIGPDTKFKKANKFLSEKLYQDWWDLATKTVEELKTRPGTTRIFEGMEPGEPDRADVGTSKRTAGTANPNPMDYIDKFTIQFKREHGYETTTALATLDSIRGGPFSYKGDIQINQVDIIDAIFADLGVNYQQSFKKQGFKKTIEHRLDLRIGVNNPLDTDVQNIKKVAGQTIRQQMEKELMNTAASMMPVPTSIDFEASKSPRKQIEEDSVVTIAKAIKKNLKSKKNLKVTTKLKAKALKNQKRKMRIKKPRPSKAVRKQTLVDSGTVITGTKVANRRAKGKKSPDATLELMKLKKRINRQLPSTIKQNMGRPALINRTGRFAESAEVVNLTQAPNTIRADYTYQLRPYETFENTGDKQWPTGYNPKPLIAKSIRQIAMVEVSDKFTLRRV